MTPSSAFGGEVRERIEREVRDNRAARLRAVATLDCPTCGAAPGEPCRASSPRTKYYPHKQVHVARWRHLLPAQP